MKKFMAIIGIVCVIFCGFIMVGFTNGQETVSHEDSLEAKNEKIKELQSDLYDRVYWEACKANKDADLSLSQEEFEKLEEALSEYNIELKPVIDDLYRDENGDLAISCHYVAVKTYDGYAVGVDCL